MAVTVSTLPAYPSVNEKVTLIGTSDAYQDDDVEFSLTAVPRESKLALGLVTERHANVARATSIAVTFVARKDLARIVPAAITRTSGSFVVDGFKPGMVLDITGATTAANNKRVTIANVTTKEITISLASTFTAESGTVSLVGGVYGDSPATNTITFDVPGEYGISAAEHFVWPGIGAGYNGDPLGVPQKRLMSVATATIYVGDHLDLPIEPVNGHGSTLRIFVVNETVRGAQLVNPKTELARVAALDSTVAAAVSALVGVAVTGIDVEFASDVNDLCTKFAAHIIRTAGSAHVSADTTNTLLREPVFSVPAAIERLNDLASKMIGHQRATTAGGQWHLADDEKNVLQVASSAKTLGQAVVLKADLRERCYERHREQITDPTSHGGAGDTTNTMSAPLTLPAAIVAYLDFIASNAPSIPAGESEGIGDAQAAWGFGRAA
jgi:hypothetical protein